MHKEGKDHTYIALYNEAAESVRKKRDVLFNFH